MKDLGIDKLPADQQRALFQEIWESPDDVSKAKVLRHGGEVGLHHRTPRWSGERYCQ